MGESVKDELEENGKGKTRARTTPKGERDATQTEGMGFKIWSW